MRLFTTAELLVVLLFQLPIKISSDVTGSSP